MDILTLLERAERAGLRLHLDGDTLAIRGPREAAGIVAELRQHKPAVVLAWWTWQARRLLAQVPDPDVRQDLTDLFDEIAAHREYEQNQHRREAEQIAFGALVAALLARGLPVRCSIERERAA